MLTRFTAALLAFLACAGCLAPPAGAQEVDRIAAVVNDEIVSIQDIEARTRMALVMSNLPDNIENRRRVVPQVIRKMIDERLQLQEATRLKISVNPAEVDNGIATVERQNRMPPGSLLSELRKSGIDPQAVREQIKADLAWIKVGSRLLQPTVRIGEEEIDDRLEGLKARQGRPEYLVGEIFLAVDAPRQEEEARNLGDRLIEQLRTGAPFAALARQFSQSPTAANGGQMGWVGDGQLEEDLNAVLAQMKPGTISKAIRSSSGYHILALVDRRIAGATGAAGETMVSLAQVVFPIPRGKDAPPRQALAARAVEMTEPAKNCDELEAIGRRIHSPSSGRTPKVRLTELPVQSRQAAAELAVGKASQALDLPEGIQILMVCERDIAAAFVLPTRDTLRRNIEDERVDLLARRLLRDLRRAAFIDIRM